jgi:hypothetical protein
MRLDYRPKRFQNIGVKLLRCQFGWVVSYLTKAVMLRFQAFFALCSVVLTQAARW